MHFSLPSVLAMQDQYLYWMHIAIANYYNKLAHNFVLTLPVLFIKEMWCIFELQSLLSNNMHSKPMYNSYTLNSIGL